MRFLIKQKTLTLTDSYEIYDETGFPMYFVKAEPSKEEHQFCIYDNHQNKAGAIRQKPLSSPPVFEIEINGGIKGTINAGYENDYNGWQLKGDLRGWNYDVYSGGSLIIHVSKALFQWGDRRDAYAVINISNPLDELEALMLVIAINIINCLQSNPYGGST